MNGSLDLIALPLQMFAQTVQVFGRLMSYGVDTFVGGTVQMFGCALAGSGPDFADEPDDGAPLRRGEAAALDGALDDQAVKLVRYSIVSVKRGAERALPGGSGEVVVTEAMSRQAFVNWRIARYVEEHPHVVPRGEERFLRLHYEVLQSWPEEPLRFQEQQLAALEGIRRAIVDRGGPPRKSRPRGGKRGPGSKT